jgi:hypothetical protein
VIPHRLVSGLVAVVVAATVTLTTGCSDNKGNATPKEYTPLPKDPPGGSAGGGGRKAVTPAGGKAVNKAGSSGAIE